MIACINIIKIPKQFLGEDWAPEPPFLLVRVSYPEQLFGEELISDIYILASFLCSFNYFFKNYFIFSL